MEEILTQYQKDNINKRLKKNFDEELIRSNTDLVRKNFYKNLKILLNILTNSLCDNGVFFFKFTIVMPFLSLDDLDLWYYVNLHVEGWISTFRTEIELVEFVYISIEKDKFGIPFIKGLLGVRSLIGNNLFIINEIRKVFTIWKGIDFELNKLESTIDILNYWNLIIKQQNFKFHRFQYFSRFYEFEYGSIADLELQYDEEEVAFDLVHNFDSKYNYIKGISEINPDPETIINYLITIYMLEQKLYLFDNKIYKKLLNNNYELIGQIDYLRKNNILIIEELKKKFPQQLNGLSIPKLFNRGWNKFFEDIKTNNHYLPVSDINIS